jgi:hypothetical protein
MKTKAIIAFAIFLLVLTTPFIVAAAQGNIGNAATAPQLADECAPNDDYCLERPDPAKGDVCSITGDNEYVTANHPVVLKDERNEAVRHGVRNKDHSLKECFTCHVDKKTFCDRCHDYSGVQPTCFNNAGGCHDTGENNKNNLGGTV